MANQFEYIMSGCGYARLLFPNMYQSPHVARIQKTLDTMQTVSEHKFGMLFNAFVEAKFGEALETYNKNLHSIHADSGGLQMITRGMSVTPEGMDNIYKVQSQYSHVAMCFDEIPLEFSGASSKRSDTTNRWFNAAKVEQCARNTGRNIARQFEIFAQNPTNISRPMLILQGNCESSFVDWYNYAMEEIPEELHSQLAGIAMASSSMGMGLLEDIKRAFIYTQLPDKGMRRQLHLLGVGSVSRLLPILAFERNGMLYDTHVSYDSTSHSSGIHMGRTYLDEKNFQFPRHFDKQVYHRIHTEIQRSFDMSDISLEDFFVYTNASQQKIVDKYGELTHDRHFLWFYSNFLIGMLSVKNFMQHVDTVRASQDNLVACAKQNGIGNVIRSLCYVKNKDDFRMWERDVGRTIKSNPISAKRSTLGKFRNAN